MKLQKITAGTLSVLAGLTTPSHSISLPQHQLPSPRRDQMIRPCSFEGVAPGIDVLRSRNFNVLQGKKVGLVTNQTGRTLTEESTIDVLRSAKGVQLVALFAPEHGVRGTVAAGQNVRTARDATTGLPIYSLYGGTRQPTGSMLRGIQTLVFDLQSIGTRSYTFLATLEKCRQACAANGVNFVVLDRPNPLGAGAEGNIPTHFSFVCPFPIPYRTGLTLGETALWLNARAARKCNLTVIPLENYQRQPFVDTGLTWVPTSPNIPRATSPFFYEATGILGELPVLSIGIGTSAPFELAGAPGLDARALAARLNSRKLKGWNFVSTSWVPRQGRYVRKRCQGVRIQLTDPAVAQTTRLNFEIYDAVRHVAPSLNFFKSSRNNAMFDLICGTTKIRKSMQQGKSSTELWNVWNQGAKEFQSRTTAFRLYPN